MAHFSQNMATDFVRGIKNLQSNTMRISQGCSHFFHIATNKYHQAKDTEKNQWFPYHIWLYLLAHLTMDDAVHACNKK